MSAEHGNVLRRLLAAWVVVALVASGLAGTGGGSDTVADGDPAPAAPGSRSTIHVDIGGGGDYTRIQDAIDSASDGDTIHVWNGTYFENLQIHKTLTIMGNGTEHTIVDGGGVGNVINITVDWVNITGVCIRNSSNDYDPEVGTGIHSKWGDNVTFSFNRIHDNRYGIYLRKSDNSRISNNVIETNWNGNVYLDECYETMIDNNTIQNSHGDGIRIMYSPRVKICDNFVDDHSDSGLFLTGSEHSLVRGNTFNNSRDSGIVFETLTDHARIEGNICNNNTPEGVSVGFCNNSTIRNNNISGNGRAGLLITKSSDCFISSNIISGNDDEGLKLNYLSNRNVIEDNFCTSNTYGILLRGDCQYNTIVGNICRSNQDGGISLRPGSHFNSITENVLVDNRYGFGTQSLNNTIEGNNISDNQYSGIAVYHTSGNRIINNTFHDNGGEGIKVHHLSMENVVYNNTLQGNRHGIVVWDDSERNDIAGNCISGSIYSGIDVSWDCHQNMVTHNIVEFSTTEGIYLKYNYGNMVTNNTLISNAVGLYLNESVDNDIYHNNFIDNTVQAMGNMSNRFDNGGGEGNYWSDYTGLDNGYGGRISGDGVGDTAIPHLGFDLYPFTNRSGWMVEGILGTPLLTAPAGISYTGNFTLEWTGSLRATGYSLEESPGPDFNESAVVFRGSRQYFTLANRTDGTYHYRVRAFNDVSLGNWSDLVSVKVVGAVDVTMDEDGVAILSAPLLFWNMSIGTATFSCINPYIFVEFNESLQQFILRPMADWSGFENVSLHGDDGNVSWSLLIRVKIFPVNDPPGPVYIEHPTDGRTLLEGEKAYFKASCKDPDLPYGEKLEFMWYGNTSGYLGNGSTIRDISFPYGAQNIQVIVTDQGGDKASASVNITVTGSYTLDDDDDGMPNQWERDFGLDPYNPSDAAGDADGDNVTNLQEYQEGTDPTVDENPGGDGGVVDGEDGGEDGGGGTEDSGEGSPGDGVSDGDDDAEGTAEKEDSGVGGGNLGTILAVLVVLVVLGLFINEILLTRKWNRERDMHRREGAPAEHEMAPYDPRPHGVRNPAGDFEDGTLDITSFMVEGAEERQALPSGDVDDVQSPDVVESVDEGGSTAGDADTDPLNPASRKILIHLAILYGLHRNRG